MRQSGATETELCALERDGVLVPIRTWRTLWLTRCYTPDQVDVARWFISSRRAEEQLQKREHELADDA